MGAYSPAPIATEELLSYVDENVLVPIVDALRNDGVDYSGVLYVGLMLTPGGPKVLEFNCRFGDPETQVILSRLESDLFDLLEAVVNGKLADADVRSTAKPSVCVVMASKGYPGAYERHKTIEGLDVAANMDDVHVYHAGTRLGNNRVLSTGGRVLGVTALGFDLADAKARAYQAVDVIKFDNAFCRRDIADKAIHATAGS